MLSAQGQTPVTPEQGAAVAKEIGAKYMECSAKTGQYVGDVFTAALREGCKTRFLAMGSGSGSMRRKRCVIL